MEVQVFNINDLVNFIRYLVFFKIEFKVFEHVRCNKFEPPYVVYTVNIKEFDCEL